VGGRAQALRGNVMTGELLLEHGAAVSAMDAQQSTPLHCAAAYGRLDMCRMLLDRGADASLADMNGDTPLDMAIDYKRQEVAVFLAEMGCPCASHDAAKAAKESEWVPDPLWPQGYKKDLFVAEDEEDGETDTEELVERLYRVGQQGGEGDMLDDDDDGGVSVASDSAAGSSVLPPPLARPELRSGPPVSRACPAVRGRAHGRALCLVRTRAIVQGLMGAGARQGDGEHQLQPGGRAREGAAGRGGVAAATGVAGADDADREVSTGWSSDASSPAPRPTGRAAPGGGTTGTTGAAAPGGAALADDDSSGWSSSPESAGAAAGTGGQQARRGREPGGREVLSNDWSSSQ